MLKGKLRKLLSKNQAASLAHPAAPSRVGRFELKLPASSGYHHQHRLSLYRFLAENIPILNGAIWLWTRLCSAPVEFRFTRLPDTVGRNVITDLDLKLVPLSYQKAGGIETLVNLFFRSLFIDGCFGGEIILDPRGRAVSEFMPCDARFLSFEKAAGGWQIYVENETARAKVDPGSFYLTGLDSTFQDPRGTSLLSSIEFISHIEQKLIYDMAQVFERSGYHRIQVQLRKPDRQPGENEPHYVERANGYFDSTVNLMKSLTPADSAVTWDDVEIKTIGPSSQTPISNWYLYHRAIVEDICAGVHLDPFMLGYSFGTTQTWARFKFELMMRQIVAVQEKARSFLRWLVSLDMALKGLPGEVEVIFDNWRVFGSLERFKAENILAQGIIAQYNAGLLDREEARERLAKIEPGIV